MFSQTMFMAADRRLRPIADVRGETVRPVTAYLLTHDPAIKAALQADIDGFRAIALSPSLTPASHELTADGHLGERGCTVDGERRIAYNRRRGR